MKDIFFLHTECVLNCFPTRDTEAKAIMDWVHDGLESDKYSKYPAYQELVGLIPDRHREEIFLQFKKLVNTVNPNFNFQTEEAQDLAKQVVIKRCQDAIEGRVPAWQLMNTNYALEEFYWIKKNDREIHLPEWIYGLYAICDVYPEENFQPYHIDELKKFIDQVLQTR